MAEELYCYVQRCCDSLRDQTYDSYFLYNRRLICRSTWFWRLTSQPTAARNTRQSSILINIIHKILLRWLVLAYVPVALYLDSTIETIEVNQVYWRRDITTSLPSQQLPLILHDSLSACNYVLGQDPGLILDTEFEAPTKSHSQPQIRRRQLSGD